MNNFNTEAIDIFNIIDVEDGVIYCTVNEAVITFQIMPQINPDQKGEQDGTY